MHQAEGGEGCLGAFRDAPEISSIDCYLLPISKFGPILVQENS